MLPWFVNLLASWSSLFSNHAVLRTAVDFAHVGGLLAGGGTAVTMDALTLGAARQGDGPRHAHLSLLRGSHRMVIGGLVVVLVSGILLLGADLETYWGSRLFWLKMTLVAALLVNGIRLKRAAAAAEAGQAGAWRGLSRAAIASLALWFLTTFIGSALPNV